MVKLSPITISLISLVVIGGLSALILKLTKPGFVKEVKKDGKKKLSIDRLIAWSSLFGLVTALISLLITMCLESRHR